MLASPKPAPDLGEGGDTTLILPARLYAHSDQPGRTSERTHDDCQWLDEEDGKQNVFRYGRDRAGRKRSPDIA
jgi:hypothetical protein